MQEPFQLGKSKDITGQVFTRLTAIRPIAKRLVGSVNAVVWLCHCSCGKEHEAYGHTLSSGHTKSCGCLKTDVTAARNTKHGKSDTKLYSRWKLIRQRALTGSSPRAADYVERGVRLCEGWQEYERFERDVGDRSGEGLSLERMNNDVGYTCGSCPECSSNGWPMNVAWADATTQNNNTRRNHRITVGGETMTIAQWSRRVGVSPSLINARINKLGWTPERAVSTPARAMNT